MKYLSSNRAAIRTFACVLTAIGTVVTPTLLQAADVSPIGEITVTAERREANLQTVPVAVSALDSTVLENRQVTDYQDLQRFVPSLKMTNNITSPTNLSPSLRGSLQQDASLIVAESPFGIYVDDVYVGRLNGNNISLNDIDRVEVLRGPQGTLYGRNTLSGALKFVTKNPTLDSNWLDASTGGGNFSQYFASTSMGGPLGDGFAGSFAAQYNTKKGEYYNIATQQKTDRQSSAAFRAKLRYLGMDHLDAVLSFSYVDSKNDALQLVPENTSGSCGRPAVNDQSQYSSNDLCPLFGPYRVATPTLAAAGPAPISRDPSGETKQLITALNVSYDFSAFVLRSITGFVNTKDFFSTDFSGIGTIIGGSTVDSNQVTEELQILGTAFNDRLSYLGGIYFLNEKGGQDFGWIFFTPASTSQITAETNSIAVFGQADFKITDALKATAGIRWVHDQKSFMISQQILPSSIIPGPANNSVELGNGYSQLTPKFGLDYQFQPIGVFDSLLTYVSAAKGFKSGGYNGIAIFNLNDAKTAYGPEKNWTFEGGVKTDAFNRHFRMNAAYFYARIDDLTLNSTGPNGSFPVQNVGAASIHGLELEFTWVPTDRLTVFWNPTFEHGTYGILDPTSAPAQAPVRWGVNGRPPQLPSLAFDFGFDYNTPVLMPAGMSNGTFRVGMDWFRTDEYVTSATNDFIASAYDRLNGYVGLGFGEHLDFRFTIKNMTDRYDVTSGSRNTPGAVGGPTGLGGFIAMPPREYVVSVNYKM